MTFRWTAGPEFRTQTGGLDSTNDFRNVEVSVTSFPTVFPIPSHSPSFSFFRMWWASKAHSPVPYSRVVSADRIDHRRLVIVVNAAPNWLHLFTTLTDCRLLLRLQRFELASVCKMNWVSFSRASDSGFYYLIRSSPVLGNYFTVT